MRKRGAPLSRSAIMARVKGRDTRPEMVVRRALYAAGLRYRLQAKELPGRPDIVFRSARLAIFVHGCFWHQHADCKHARMPKTRLDFWQPKLASNVERDARKATHLEALGWKILTLWECETRDAAKVADFVEEVVRRLHTATEPSTPESIRDG